MAVGTYFTPEMKTFSRAKGHHAVEAAAYRSGEVLIDERLRPLKEKDVAHLPEEKREKVLADREQLRNSVIDRKAYSRMEFVKRLSEEKQNEILKGRTLEEYETDYKAYAAKWIHRHNYARRDGVAYTEITAPKGSPAWVYDRSELWNEVEKKENRKNSQVAHEWMVPLPNDLNDEQRIEITQSIGEFLADRYSVPVDMAVHRPSPQGDQRNHHAHIMFPTRDMNVNDNQAEWGNKLRVLSTKTTNVDEIKTLRQKMAEFVNSGLEKAGLSYRVSGKSYKELGINQEPQKHNGKNATALERSGKPTARSEEQKEIAKTNAFKNAFGNLDKLKENNDNVHQAEFLAIQEKYFKKKEDLPDFRQFRNYEKGRAETWAERERDFER